MIVKYILDEGGLIRELDNQKNIPLHGKSKYKDLVEWLRPIRETRFQDTMALNQGPKVWRVELDTDIWVVGILIFKKDKQVAAYYADKDILFADEKIWGALI